jgi:hypothetical protein
MSNRYGPQGGVQSTAGVSARTDLAALADPARTILPTSPSRRRWSASLPRGRALVGGLLSVGLLAGAGVVAYGKLHPGGGPKTVAELRATGASTGAVRGVGNNSWITDPPLHGGSPESGSPPLTVSVPPAVVQSALLKVGTASSLTPAQARQVVAAFWPVHERALAGSDAAALRMLDVPDSTADVADNIQSECGCPAAMTYEARPLQAFRVYVTAGKAATSLTAEVATVDDGVPQITVLAMARPTASDPWRLAESVTYIVPAGQQSRLDAGTFDAHGYDRPIPSALAAGPALAVKLAGVWAHAKETGDPHPSAAFGPSWFDGALLQELAAHKQDTVESTGLSRHTTFTATGVTFGMDAGRGRTLVCGGVMETEKLTAPPGKWVRQDVEGQNFNLVWPTGGYEAMGSTILWSVCFSTSPRAAPVVVGSDARALTDYFPTSRTSPVTSKS